MKKVLIIKLGYTETLENALSFTASLGDVLRTTVILHFFKGDEVSWLVDEKAAGLLADNPFISRVLTYDAGSFARLTQEKFDVVINLEKLPEICLLAESIECVTYLGFRIGHGGGAADEATRRLTELALNTDKRRQSRECWQKILADALGEVWDGQPYVLGYRPTTPVRYDVGFNWATGSKWTNKAWNEENWRALDTLLKDTCSVSWQRGLSSISEYVDWINSCRLLVTSDSLGLHIALALGKRVVALFGPTSPHEIYFYGLGSYILPETPYTCIPCLSPYCSQPRQCMEFISPERVKERVIYELKNTAPSGTV